MRRVAALVLGLSALAACSSGGGDDGPAAPPPSTTRVEVPDTTAAPTSAPAPTTTVPSGPLSPLTGVPMDVALAGRPALVVKIDNAPEARPQAGLNQADLVYEEVVEGVTRFAAVFHSADADPVGPVRSARTTDLHLVSALGRPLFAFAGGNDYTRAAFRRAPIVDVGMFARQDAYWRDRGRRAPNNLYSSTATLRSTTPGDAAPPPPQFVYRGLGEGLAPEARPTVGVRLAYRYGLVAEYRWDPGRGEWPRWQAGQPHLDAAGAQVAPENVVVLEVPYVTSPADPRSPEAVTTGGGRAWVMTLGHVVEGRWSRSDPAAPLAIPARLTPGRTWVALVQSGGVTLLQP